MRQDSAPDRFRLLLPWLNGEAIRPSAACRAIRAFVATFDGSPRVGHLEVADLPSEGDVRDALLRTAGAAHGNRTELEVLQQLVLRMLASGFQKNEAWSDDYVSLDFGVRNARRRAPGKLTRVGRRARAAYMAPGAFVLRIRAPLLDLVPFLVAHLLTAPDVLTIGRCAAPAPNNWKERCGHFLIKFGRGHPRDFCSKACRTRNHEEQKHRQAQETRRTR